MSINKAQASALAEGFLNTVGSDPEEFKPLECVTEALTIAGEFATLAQGFCPVHAGKLASSIAVEQPEQLSGGGVSIDITMLAYGQFLEKGVRGTKSGAGVYSFKNDMPGRSMLKAIKEYIKTAKLSTATIKKHPIGKQEIKNTSIAEAQSVFAMARSIKQHGIKAVHFIGRAAQIVDSKYSIVLGDALVKDVYNSLPDTL